MVYEAKLHQFIGQMLATTLSGESVRPTVLGSVVALSRAKRTRPMVWFRIRREEGMTWTNRVDAGGLLSLAVVIVSLSVRPAAAVVTLVDATTLVGIDGQCSFP